LNDPTWLDGAAPLFASAFVVWGSPVTWLESSPSA
jgi:hypothetical protein